MLTLAKGTISHRYSMQKTNSFLENSSSLFFKKSIIYFQLYFLNLNLSLGRFCKIISFCSLWSSSNLLTMFLFLLLFFGSPLLQNQAHPPMSLTWPPRARWSSRLNFGYFLFHFLNSSPGSLWFFRSCSILHPSGQQCYLFQLLIFSSSISSQLKNHYFRESIKSIR